MQLTRALPRVAITYCTQCRWMLRAAYFAQELLSTFGTAVGEIALLPSTGGKFTVELSYVPVVSEENLSLPEGEKIKVKTVLIWDRKAEGGFPETKVLKQRVRDHIDPSKDLGHSDRHGKKTPAEVPPETSTEGHAGEHGKSKATSAHDDKEACEDCK